MENEELQKLWNEKWGPEVHETADAKKRIASAKSAKLTPVKIDREDCYGYFQGSYGKYETFLDNCTCIDFHRRKKPCKHIYRLAMELGLMDEKTESNKNAIVTPKNERATLDETVDLIESLSEDAQRKLLEISRNIRSTTPTLLVYETDELKELLHSGIIVDVEPGTYKIKFGTKKDITELLDSENIQYKKSDKKDVLQNLCIENIEDKAIEKFGKSIYVTIPTKYKPVKIHHYLRRKFEREFFCANLPEVLNGVELDEANLHEIDLSGLEVFDIPLLETDLPDDDVTDQLIKHGYYKRK